METVKSFRLLDLPLEIRDKIYFELIGSCVFRDYSGSHYPPSDPAGDEDWDCPHVLDGITYSDGLCACPLALDDSGNLQRALS